MKTRLLGVDFFHVDRQTRRSLWPLFAILRTRLKSGHVPYTRLTESHIHSVGRKVATFEGFSLSSISQLDDVDCPNAYILTSSCGCSGLSGNKRLSLFVELLDYRGKHLDLGERK